MVNWETATDKLQKIMVVLKSLETTQKEKVKRLDLMISKDTAENEKDPVSTAD